MQKFKVYKTLALPTVPDTNSVYYVADPLSSDYMQMYVVGTTPTNVRRIPLLSDIQSIINLSLGSYSTTAQMNTAINSAITSAFLGFTQIEVVADIPARNALNPTINTLAFVQDATGDITVPFGPATYVYDTISSTWNKISGTAITTLAWSSITGGPTASPAAIDAAVAASHTHPNLPILNSIDANWDTPVLRPILSGVTAGQAIRPNNLGQMVLAQADSIGNCGGTTLAGTTALPGFVTKLTDKYLTLTDWTAATGSAALTPYADYYLSPTVPGELTTVPPTTLGEVLLQVGTAIDTQTMGLFGNDPIEL